MPKFMTVFLSIGGKGYIFGQILDLANQRVFVKFFFARSQRTVHIWEAGNWD